MNDRPVSVQFDELLRLIGEKEMALYLQRQEIGRLQAEVQRLRADLGEATKDKALTHPS